VLSLDEALAIIRDTLKVSAHVGSVPYVAAYAAGAVADAITMLTRIPVPFSRARVAALVNATAYDGSRSKLLFGGDYPCGLPRALGDLAREYRQRGLV
jgi:predicted TIM-barrel fold metal-dependent hydrolase